MNKLYNYWLESIRHIRFSHENKNTDTEWGFEQINEELIIVFQGSVSLLDWRQNLMFLCKPYKNMPIPWKAHKGFALKYHSIRDNVLTVVQSGIKHGIKKIEIRGYSQGAAIAILAHEDLIYNTDMVVNTVVFGCPRVVSKKIRSEIGERFVGIKRITHGGDIVTGLPPGIFGYKHYGKEMKIGKQKKYRLSIRDHLIKNITATLEDA